jgi:hypothetical protein
MSDFTSGNVPGLATKTEAEEAQVTWAGRYGQDLVATRRVTLDAAAVDSGNSPTTTLRGGNVLALVDASGKAHTYDPDANDGRQMAVGIIEHYQNMLVDGVAADRFTQILVHGLVKESELVGLDPRGKQQLGARFVFDRDLGASLGVLMHPRGIYRNSANYVVTRRTTASCSWRLPPCRSRCRRTERPGVPFPQTADFDLSIAGSGDIVHKGAAASSVAFSTAGQRIGSHA